MSIKKFGKSMKNLPKTITKGVEKVIFKSITSLFKKMVDTMGKPIMNTLKGFQKIFMLIKKYMMNIIRMIVDGFKLVFYYIKCAIKLLTNFYKCIIFYILDVLKYFFIYLPIFIVMNMIGLKKEWNNVQKQLDKLVGWPNGVQNDCYRCTNKKGENFDWRKIFDMFTKKQEEAESKFNFLFFMLVCGVAAAIVYTFWHIWIRKNI